MSVESLLRHCSSRQLCAVHQQCRVVGVKRAASPYAHTAATQAASRAGCSMAVAGMAAALLPSRVMTRRTSGLHSLGHCRNAVVDVPAPRAVGWWQTSTLYEGNAVQPTCGKGGPGLAQCAAAERHQPAAHRTYRSEGAQPAAGNNSSAAAHQICWRFVSGRGPLRASAPCGGSAPNCSK